MEQEPTLATVEHVSLEKRPMLRNALQSFSASSKRRDKIEE
jgi:hypothetical protein